MDWRDRGNCAPVNYTRGIADELQVAHALADLDEKMYPTSGAGSTVRDERVRAHARGKAVCASCPVVAECLAAALEEEGGGGSGRWGVRGALAPDERTELYRRNRRRSGS